MFEKMNIRNGRQFSEADIDFHEHLAVLTG